MKTKKLFLAALATLALASCVSDDFVGEAVNTAQEANDGAINFGFNVQNTTRADIAGSAAANLLGSNFYVTGTKGTEAETSPSPTLVFDNYLVHYGVNTAGTTESNTANWEYVGVTPTGNYVKLGSYTAQTIKYWDYSAAQYDFLAFSTGSYKAVSGSSGGADEIGVTKMKYGTALAGATAYTFDIPSVNALKNTFITDITEVLPANYSKEVTLKFKNLGSKVRMALYETVPGYSVKNVSFYQVDGTTDFSGAKSNTAKLISAEGLPIKGTIAVSFPYIGTNNQSAAAYDKASATVTPAVSEGTEAYQTYGTLSNFADEDGGEESSPIYLGRSLPTATYAGSEDADYYTTVFPVSDPHALTLRVDYTLVATDGSGETINIYGAKAVVPSTYTKWLPNYAYTYIFKISDNTNGWTDPDHTKAGLFPITFDAVVTEATDAMAEQTTITTVSAPTITTYQQNHTKTSTPDEYSKATAKNIYVQVMNNTAVPASLVNTLAAANSLVYELNEAATEAEVMDALVMRKTAVATSNVVGRNGLELTKRDVISNTVTSIVNGADDKPITVASGSAGEIAIASLTAGKSYAYVYISTASDEEINQYEPVTVTEDSPISGDDEDTFYKLAYTSIDGGTELAVAEAPDDDYLYFTVTENGTGTKTYSYVSPIGKATIPAGYKKVLKTALTSVTGDQDAVANTFYFDKFITNNGSYAVKVIKIAS